MFCQFRELSISLPKQIIYGMNWQKSDIDRELNIIVEAVRSQTEPVAIYLFGSYAYGVPHKDSDLDIYAVVPDSVEDIPELQANIRGAILGKSRLPLDLLIGKQSSFEWRKDALTLEKTVLTKGMKLYGD
jgi:predicted nucleotidyltransferase